MRHMQPDLEFLRRHYAALSDEALLEIDRAELVDAARSLYDHELVERKLVTKHSVVRARVDQRDDEEPEAATAFLHASKGDLVAVPFYGAATDYGDGPETIGNDEVRRPLSLGKDLAQFVETRGFDEGAAVTAGNIPHHVRAIGV